MAEADFLGDVYISLKSQDLVVLWSWNTPSQTVMIGVYLMSVKMKIDVTIQFHLSRWKF